MNSTLSDVSLSARAQAVLALCDAEAKALGAQALGADWAAARIAAIGDARPLARPGRPAKPELRPPQQMPKRNARGGPAARVALLHALAHIELNAIDLALDLAIRFPEEHLPRAFVDDWIGVAADEGRHFLLLRDRLRALGSDYGALPAHDGLWMSATGTAGDIAARLAVAPMVLEARGLDVTPATIAKLRQAGDDASADILQIIYDDEIGHVAAGRRWFGWICKARGIGDVAGEWRRLVRQHFDGVVKPPFNEPARAEAGMTLDFHATLAAEQSAETSPA